MRFLTFIITLFSIQMLSAQSGIWKAYQPLSRNSARIKTIKSDFYHLDVLKLKQSLKSSPSEHSRDLIPAFIELPLSDGKMVKFEVRQTNTIDPMLQSKYPGINNYLIRAVDNDRINGRIDYTYQGFHAMIREGRNLTFIDPAFENNQIDYMVYDKINLISENKFSCQFDDSQIEKQVISESRLSDNNHRLYRMAISCTGEYSQFHGGTVELTLSAMNTTINRINFVYEHDFAVRFLIVSNTDELIYTDPDSDPYDNDDIGMQLDENQSQCDTKIGSENYDIGHIFSTGGGGLAGYAVACRDGSKAIGGTGSGSPVNDGFDIDYVAHEVGHQLSGGHTQNNDCNRDGNASYEPGSASTIMGYAGICSPDVQPHSDAYFHGFSLREMGQYIVNGAGNSCPERTVISGEKPVITASSGNFTIPKLTPFELTASATGDFPLLYCWEQFDREVAEVQPPVSTNKSGPLYRSYFEDSTGIRTFPRIDYIVNNTNNTWEALPGVKRDINFVLTVREDNVGGSRHNQKLNKLAVDDTKGPFLVQNPNVQNITWFSSQTQTVSWDVANTDQSPINCNEVRIMLSEDGGYTYPHTLLITENDGSEEIQVPEIFGNKMRIKVAANNNVFFDISNNDFIIKEGLPPYTIDNEFPEVALCEGDSVSFYLTSSDLDSNADTIIVSELSNINGLDVQFASDTLFTGDSVIVIIRNVSASQGIKSIELKFESSILTIVRSFNINSIVLPAVSTLTTPANYAENVVTGAPFVWTAVTNQSVSYEVQYATDKNFENILTAVTGLSTNTAIINYPFESNTTYYWRVRSLGQCGYSNFSNAFIFRTATCQQVFSSPFMTTQFTQSIVTDTINVADLPFEKISDINLIGIRGYVEAVEDISVTFTNGAGLSAKLWSEACSGNRDMDLSFDDNSTTTEIPCDVNPQILGLGELAIKPQEPLSVFNGSDANNSYSMVIEDNNPSNGGSLEQWGINICGATPVCSPLRIPTVTRLYTADLACTDGEGWTHYSISAAENPIGNFDLMVMSLKLNEGDVILPEEVSIRIPSSARYTKINTAQYVNDASNWTVLNRHWLVNPAIQPSSEVGVRFYLTDVEVNSLLDITGLSGEFDSLKVFSLYSNGTLNPNPVNKHVNVQATDVRLHESTLIDYNFSKYLEFTTNYLADGCVGAGGTFKAVSEIDKVDDKLIIKVYPNPANDQVKLENSADASFEYVIFNIYGNKMKAGTINKSGIIDTKHLNSGTYILKYISGSSSGITKLEIIR